MISKRDFRITHIYFWLYCKLCALPLEFELETGQAKISINRVRRLIWKAWFALYVLYWSFATFRLLESLLIHHENLVLQYVPFHNICFVSMTYCIVSAYITFYIWPEESVALFNQHHLLWSTGKRARSTQFLLLLSFPNMLTSCWLSFIALYLYDPKAMQFLYSALPKEYQTKAYLFVFVSMEFATIYFWLALFHFTLFVQLSFFLSFDARINSMKEMIRSPGRILLESMEKSFKTCRELQLVILIFNRCNANLIFGYKLFCLIIPIVSLYMAFHLFSIHPLISSCCVYMSFYTITGFVLIYDRAFTIPEKMGSLKLNMMVALKSDRFGELGRKRQLERELGSIWDIGVKVGSFYALERHSSLVFLHFVVTSVCSLLVSFP